MKTCFKCNKTKEFTEFYKHNRMAGGYLGKCKECTKKDTRNYYKKTFEARREYEKNRFQTKERKEAAANYQRKYRAKNKDKYKARGIVNNAIRDGHLIKQPCEICGSKESQSHHDDYNRPLDVHWFYFAHHRSEKHGQINATKPSTGD
jgi:hypothetical protein